MELQRHASILLRLSDELLHLAGKYDTGQGNDQVRADMFANVSTMREQIEQIEIRLSIQAPAERVTGRTPFEVTLWQTPDAPAPFATVPMNAKMPLGALVFAMQSAQVKKAGYAVVSIASGQTTFYNVRLNRERVTYERHVEVPGTDQGD
jgi:hypothetical protein